eukprot:RCo039534
MEPDAAHHSLLMLGVHEVKGNNGQLYRLIELLDRHSFGVVYLSEEDATGRQVMIKEIMRNSDRKALVYSVDTLNKLQSGHVNIVQLHDVVYHEDGKRVLIVMEHLPHSLQTLLSHVHSIAVGELRKYLGQILDGLDFLHSEVKLVHGDLKPANLMISH